jgi:16S rRNA (guanine1207-N2)-methyltransferase
MALNQGAFVPPAGDILVLRPRIGDDLSALPQGRVVVETGFRPDHDHFAARGYRSAGGPYGSAVICLPRARAAALSLIHQAMASVPAGAPVLLDGQKTDGIDTAIKACREAGFQMGESLSKAHGKAICLTAAPAPAAWAATVREVEGGFVTLPFCFSADGPDRGSALLAAALPDRLPAHVADLGAGWGYLSRAILSRPGVQHLDLVEAEAQALTCARQNVPDPRAAFHWADVPMFKPKHMWDAVVMNPPFHTGREAEPDLGIAFIRAAHRYLSPSGTLWLVANRHLPYDRVLTTLFKQVEEIGGDASFRLTRAALPIRSR